MSVSVNTILPEIRPANTTAFLGLLKQLRGKMACEHFVLRDSKAVSTKNGVIITADFRRILGKSIDLAFYAFDEDEMSLIAASKGKTSSLIQDDRRGKLIIASENGQIETDLAVDTHENLPSIPEVTAASKIATFIPSKLKDLKTQRFVDFTVTLHQELKILPHNHQIEGDVFRSYNFPKTSGRRADCFIGEDGGSYFLVTKEKHGTHMLIETNEQLRVMQLGKNKREVMEAQRSTAAA